MDPLDTVTATLALTMGVAWASGINLYASIFMLGALGTTGNLVLPPDLQLLANPVVMMAAGGMYCLEFIADKVPGLDTGWDAIHTFIRIPAGALLAAGAVGEVNAPLALAAGLVGAGLSAGSHATKAGSRVLINASPEPFTNWVASISEDVAVIGGLWTALHHPRLFLCLLFLLILLAIWLLPRIWQGVKQVFHSLGRLFSGGPPRSPSSGPPPVP